MKRKSTIIFDFDLTLADATKGIYICMNQAFISSGYPVADFEAVKKTIGYTLPVSFQMLTGNYDLDDAQQFTSVYVALADKMMNENTYIYPEVFEILPLLKSKGFRTAIVSTKYRYRIEEILKRDNLEDYVNFIIGGEDVTAHKPDPEGLLKAIEKLKVKENEVLYIGDSIVDAEAAQAAGISFCAVLTGTTSLEAFKHKQANYIIQNLNELINIFDLNNKLH